MLEFSPDDLRRLLGRDVRSLDSACARAAIEGRRVLITGAGGSIGAELSRQAAALGCSHLAMMDNHAGSLFDALRSVDRVRPTLSRREIICDIRDAERVRDWIVREKPDFVLHAAAIKHVDMVERHPSEGVLTNVIGAANVANAVEELTGATMILISTDKAAQPRNAMGATKRLAERLVLQRSRAKSGARFGAVRFGNVFGSSNSVAVIFQDQIERGGPVTVTHERMERYFMTGEEACLLVLQATALCAGAPASGDLYGLEMGEPVAIIDLARRMVAIAEEQTGRCVSIAVTGIRDGETITEHLIGEGERMTPTAIDGVFAVDGLDRTPISRHELAELEALSRAGRDDDVVLALDRLVGMTPAQTALSA